MKTLIFSLLIITFISVSTTSKSQKESFFDKSVKKVWESSKDFKTPESVFFDESDNLLYVSNINGNPTQKDTNGFISKLGLDGKIINLKWIEGLNAPKGMGVFKNKLYVTDIDRLIIIDIKKSKIINTIEVPNSKFLNDIAIDNLGNVFVSDMLDNKIYKYRNNSIKVWVDSGKLIKPNGLLIEEHKLFVGCKNYVLSINTKDKLQKVLIDKTGSIDGLVKFNSKNYIISDWSGNVTAINTNKKKKHKKLISTKVLNINAADFEFIKSKNTLYIPTFFDNRVVAYKIEL